ncbi:AsmA protein [Sesbania bispinosa]|nr:AsmA protein [Sesbania bispinosa]
MPYRPWIRASPLKPNAIIGAKKEMKVAVVKKVHMEVVKERDGSQHEIFQPKGSEGVNNTITLDSVEESFNNITIAKVNEPSGNKAVIDKDKQNNVIGSFSTRAPKNAKK